MKRWMLGLALAATLIAAYFAPTDNVVAPVKPNVSAPRESSVAENIPQVEKSSSIELQINKRNADQDLGNVFASKTWSPPPPPPPKVQVLTGPPPPPLAPPLPFKFMGRMLDEGKSKYFFTFNDRNLAIEIGESIDQQYRLDGFAAGTLTFTYLPLNQKQTLVVGEVN